MINIVFCSGIKRSASTWSYNVCRHLTSLKAHALEGKSFAQYSSNTDITLQQLEESVTADGADSKNINLIGVIKAHQLGTRTLHLIEQNIVSNVYTIRDPRDCIASMEKFWPRTEDKTFDDRIRAFQRWLIDGDVFFQDKHTLIIRYEDLQKDPVIQVSRIAKHLQMECPEDTLKKISDATGVKASQHRIDQMVNEKTGPERVHCPVTHLHEKHLNGGLVGRWRDELSLEEQDKVQIAFYPWLIKFGYETAQSSITSHE